MVQRSGAPGRWVGPVGDDPDPTGGRHAYDHEAALTPIFTMLRRRAPRPPVRDPRRDDRSRPDRFRGDPPTAEFPVVAPPSPTETTTWWRSPVGFPAHRSGVGPFEAERDGAGPCGAGPYGGEPYGAEPYEVGRYDVTPFDVQPYDDVPSETGPYGVAPFDTASCDTGPFAVVPFGAEPYDADRYGADPYGADPCDTGPFAVVSFGAEPYDAERYDAERYDAEPYDAGPFAGDPYGADPLATGRPDPGPFGTGPFDTEPFDTGLMEAVRANTPFDAPAAHETAVGLVLPFGPRPERSSPSGGRRRDSTRYDPVTDTGRHHRRLAPAGW